MTTPFTCTEKARLVAFLYDEADAAERAAVRAHLAACPACAADLAGFQAVRADLRAWEPPDADLRFRIVQDEPDPRARGWYRIPGWFPSAAAAVLVLAAAAGIARLEVRQRPDGWQVRTGWGAAIQAGPQAAGPAATPAPVASAPAGMSEAEVRAALDEFETRLRADLAAVPEPATPAAAPAPDRAALLRQVRALIEQSERRQQRELALRLTQVVQDFDIQRRADLVRIEQGLGQLEGITGEEAARQRALINYLVRTSQRQ